MQQQGKPDDEMMTYKWSLLAIYISLCSRQIFRRCSPLGRSGGIGCPGEILPPGLKPSDERDASPGAPSRSKIAQALQNVQEHHQKEWTRRTQICKETAPYLQQVSYRSWLERTANNRKVRVGPLFCSVLRDSHSSKVCRQAWQAHMKARATSCLLNYGHRDKCTDDEMMTYKWSLLAI